MKPTTQARSFIRLALGLAPLVGSLCACPSPPPPPAKPPPRPAPVLPPMQVGQPAPQTVRATRSFTFKPTGDALADVVRDAATSVPLFYTCDRCQRSTRAANRRMIRTFNAWVRALGRLPRPRRKERQERRYKRQEQQYKRHNTVLGVTLSRESFARFRAVRPDQLTATFAAMVRRGIGPFVIKARGPVEDEFRGDQVRLRVKRGGRWTETLVKPEEVEDLFKVKEDLRQLAEEQGARLPKSVQRELARIASANLKASIVFDDKRTRAARKEAAERARETVLDFAAEQVVLKQGETFTLTHRAILDQMLSVRCDPCSGGLRACAIGARRGLKVGGVDSQAIRATRTFRILAGPEQTAVLEKQARESVPRVFIHDPRLAQRRDDKLMVLFDQAAKAAAKTRDPAEGWKRLQQGLAEELQAEVLPQLLKSFDGLTFDAVRVAVSEVYSRVQSEPIIDKSPPRHTEPCTLRTRRRGKPDEETRTDCPIVPLVRQRLLVAGRKRRNAGALKGLPPPARQAVVELAQALLVANIRFDAAETERRRRAAVARIKPKDRTFREGEVVVPAKQKLTPEDLYILEKMYSVTCRPVRR